MTVPARRAANVPYQTFGRGFQAIGFLAHLHSLTVTMSQTSSFPQPRQSVSGVLTPDTAMLEIINVRHSRSFAAEGQRGVNLHRRRLGDLLQSALSGVGARELRGDRPRSGNAVPAIAKARRFVCAACGSRRVDVSPDWRGHSAAGMGR